MISFKKKPDPQPPSNDAEDNRFEQIRKAATESHAKSDTDRQPRRRKPPAGDKPLL